MNDFTVFLTLMLTCGLLVLAGLCHNMYLNAQAKHWLLMSWDAFFISLLASGYLILFDSVRHL